MHIDYLLALGKISESMVIFTVNVRLRNLILHKLSD